MSFRSIVCGILTVFYGLAMYITAYKLPLALQQPYYIFPWETDSVISASKPTMLASHILLAMVLLTLAWLRLLLDTFLPHYVNRLRKPVRNRFNRIWLGTHGLFCLFVVMNCWNLGGIPWEQAVLSNLFGIGLLTCVRRSPIAYFLILSLPLFLELKLLFSQYLECQGMTLLQLFNPLFQNSFQSSVCRLIPPLR